jgi:hypothetical protein
MRLEPARAEEDMHALAAESFDAPAERDPAGQSGVHERQHDDGVSMPVISARTPRA